MARVEFENRLGVPLYRVLFTGTSYTVEPPPTVPPNATVFWQTDDTGSATYSAVAGGNASSEIPAETYSSSPTSPRDAVRPVTLAWEFSKTGRPKYLTRNVAAGLRADVHERFDGALYMVSQKSSKRTPIAPRRRRVLLGSSLLIGLLLIATIATAAAQGLGGLSAFRDLFNQHTVAHHNPTPTVVAPQLFLSASQPNVPEGATVTLTATANVPIPSGYEIDIFNADSNQVVNSSPCSANCVASVQSASPATITYQAFIEQGYQRGMLATSNSAMVTWLPPHIPTIRLTSSPAPNSTGTVNVTVGATVTLTATTSLSVDKVQYRIAFYDTSGNPVGRACTKGTSCSTGVILTSVGSITYVAYADPTKPGGTRVPSSLIKVVWSAPSPPPKTVTPVPHPKTVTPVPPPVIPTVSMGASPAANSDGNVNVMIGVSVTLTATASSAVDNTGYSIAIFDTNGNRVGGPCATGTVCVAHVASSGAAGNVYLAHVEQGNLTGIGSTSNTIAVNWAVPTVNLSASTTTPAFAGSFTLTADASYPVDNSGYMIQLIDRTDGSIDIHHCTTGSICGATLSCPNGAANIQYEAYVDQGNPSASVAASSAITVYCPPPPPPPSVTLSASDLSPVVGETVTLTATTPSSVTGTGYVIQIYDTSDNVWLATCNQGSSCPVNPPDPGNGACLNYQAYVDRGDPSTAEAISQQVTICWDNHIIY
jgi:hypothetical protein